MEFLPENPLAPRFFFYFISNMGDPYIGHLLEIVEKLDRVGIDIHILDKVVDSKPHLECIKECMASVNYCKYEPSLDKGSRKLPPYPASECMGSLARGRDGKIYFASWISGRWRKISNTDTLPSRFDKAPWAEDGGRNLLRRPQGGTRSRRR